MLNKMCIVFFSFVLFGCANVEMTGGIDCDGDWKKVGFETAEAGKTVRTFDEYLAACGKKAEVAKSDYLDGYTRGIIKYCSKDNGFAIGFKNLEMPKVCPYELRAEFVKGYELGLQELKIKMERYGDLAKEQEGSNRDAKADTSKPDPTKPLDH